MRREVEYGLFAIVPAMIIGAMSYVTGINNKAFCSCGICPMSLQKIGLYIGMIGFSAGLILGAITYIIWDKRMKRKNILKMIKK